jgi:hypothetical protein
LVLVAAPVVLVLVAVIAWLVVIDPYRVIPISPAFDRQPLQRNRNYSVAGLARDPQFDSAIIGSSTAAMLNPEQLNAEFGGRFVSLTIWGATAWQQSVVAGTFHHFHPSAKRVLMLLDAFWCGGSLPQRPSANTFPAWMYENPAWLIAPRLFGMVALKDSVEQLRYIRGQSRSQARIDGYEPQFPDDSLFVMDDVRTRIYGGREPKPIPSHDLDVVRKNAMDRASSRRAYPNLIYLDEIMAKFSAPTKLVLAFAPIHAYAQRSGRIDDIALYEGCKYAVVAAVGRRANTLVADLMLDSAFTRDDRNYWDPMHINRAGALRSAQLLAAADRGELEETDLIKVLYRSTAGRLK